MRPLALAAVIAIAALPAGATRVARLSPEEIRDAAAAVLVIDVLESAPRTGAAGMPWLDYRVRVAEVLRGTAIAGETRSLSFAAAIAGVPRLELGGRYLIFLDDAAGRPVPAIGWGQGIFRLDGDRIVSLDGEQPANAANAHAGQSGSCTCGGPPTVPAMWEIDHLDAAYVAASREVFDRWNAYAGLLDVRIGDGFAAPNGRNEVAFLDIATTSARYGINIGRTTFAITYMSPLSAAGNFDACPKPPEAVCGTFDETDVIVNSEFLRGWTASGPLDFADQGPALYEATLAHELGHALGFHHNVGNISVMNLYEDFAALYIAAADTAEARLAYPAHERQIADLALYPFHFDRTRTDYAATTPVEVSPTIVRAGQSMTVRNLGFENVGTEVLPGVMIRFYLSRDSTDILIGIRAFNEPAPAGFHWDDAQGGMSLTLPDGVPPGTYSLRAVVSQADGTSDSIAYNNGWTAPQRIAVVSGARRRAARH